MSNNEIVAVLRQALEALELEDMACRYEKESTPEHIANAITSLRQAIAEAEKQSTECVGPVAWESVLGAVARGWCYEENANKTMDSELAVAIAKEVHALYTHPLPKREWVGLTDQELVDLRERVQEYTPMDSIKYGEAIQHAMAEALKEKNT